MHPDEHRSRSGAPCYRANHAEIRGNDGGLRNSLGILKGVRTVANRTLIGRRTLLTGLGAIGAAAAIGITVRRKPSAARTSRPVENQHASLGPVSPAFNLPDLTLLDDAGSTFSLAARLRERVTAVQLVFTRCTSTCPVQGNLFAQVARLGNATSIAFNRCGKQYTAGTPSLDRPVRRGTRVARGGPSPRRR